MPITYKEAKALLAPYASRGGVCPSADGVDLFVRKTLEYLLISGAHGNLRKFCFKASKGCITIPYELETPLKVKVDGVVGSSWDAWFEFHDTDILNDCIPAENALFEDPNTYPVVYDMPSTGARVACVGTMVEAVDANMIVQGTDISGREIVTFHNGLQISGEYLTIKKGEMRFTNNNFGAVTGIVKSKTNGYVPLYWYDPEKMLKGYMADYPPLEEKPSYRRFKFTTPCCGVNSKVSVLGRIRLKYAYADTDYVPFSNLLEMELAGQGLNLNSSNDTAGAAAKDNFMMTVIERNNSHKKVTPGIPIEFYHPMSAGSIKNII